MPHNRAVFDRQRERWCHTKVINSVLPNPITGFVSSVGGLRKEREREGKIERNRCATSRDTKEFSRRLWNSGTRMQRCFHPRTILSVWSKVPLIRAIRFVRSSLAWPFQISPIGRQTYEIIDELLFCPLVKIGNMSDRNLLSGRECNLQPRLS